MQRDYLVIYENGPGNMCGFAPDVPGCASTGHSLEEMRSNLRDALEFHLEGLWLAGEPIPFALTRASNLPAETIHEFLTLALYGAPE